MKVVDTSIVRKSIELSESFKFIVSKDDSGTSILFHNGETDIVIFEGSAELVKGVAEVFAEVATTVQTATPKTTAKRGRKPKVKPIKVGE